MNLAQWRESAQYFPFQGHAIAWRSTRAVGAADAAPLLLIHGFPTASFDWNEVWEPLAARSQLIAADMLGFGYSAKPRNHRYSILAQADLHEQLLSQLGVDRCHILAHDYGDSVAQELLARSQSRGDQRVLSVCFLNGGLFFEAISQLPIQRLLGSRFGRLVTMFLGPNRMARSMRRIFGKMTPPSAQVLADFWEQMTANEGQKALHLVARYQSERLRHRDRWLAAMNATQAPCRFICGGADPISGAAMAEHYQRIVENADIDLWPEIGHYPQLEAPKRVVASYCEFRGWESPSVPLWKRGKT